MNNKLILPAIALLAGGTSAQAVINEIRIDNGGADTDEYVELAGAPGTDLTGLTFFTIGDGAGGTGTIDDCGGSTPPIDLTGQIIPADGTFLIAINSPLPTLGATPDLQVPMCLENSDNVTHMLVSGFTGAGGDDLDTDDDGVLDVTPWTAIVDQVALFESPTSGEFTYGPVVVGPDGNFVPAQAYRFPDGLAELSSWNVGAFGLGITDTAGSANIAPEIVDADGGTQDLIIDVGASFAGNIHVVASSLSGTTPGVTLGAINIPLNPDALTDLSLANFGGIWSNGIGTLDSNGVAYSELIIPAGNPNLVGLTMSSAAVIVDLGGSIVHATNAVEFTWI